MLAAMGTVILGLVGICIVLAAICIGLLVYCMWVGAPLPGYPENVEKN